jgi:hypothetical protein
MDNNKSAYASSSVGIPAVVVGVLIALKKVGMTAMTYSDIIWFGVEVWLVCAIIVVAIWLIVCCILVLFESR